MRIRARSILVSAIALSAWVLGSCGTTPDTGIRLEIDAVLMPGHTLDHVHVRTYDYTDMTRATIGEHDFRIGIDTLVVPFSMSIVPRDPSHPNMHLGIEVTGNVAGGPMMLTRVHTAFIPGRIYVLPVVLYENCPVMMCRGDQTCDGAGGCRDAQVDPTSFPIYGVDAARDVVMQPDTIDVPDVVDTGPPPMDVIDAVDATDDAQDVVDVPVPMDVIDATDASDVVDVPIAMDTPDVPDVPDVIDVPDVTDVVDVPDVTDVVDVRDVPSDNGLGIVCGVGFCPNSGMGPWLCGPPPMMTSCCQPNGMLTSCATVTCTNGYSCMVDPMGHAACCGPPIVP